jgi:Uma2 family endonuclease
MSVTEIVAEFPEQIRPLRRDEYDRLVELGVYDDQPIELLEGALVEVSPESDAHADVVTLLLNKLARQLPAPLSLRAGNPYAAGTLSEPEPDLAVVDTPRRRRTGHPSEAHMIIEVAYSSRHKDLGRKAGIYAAGGVPTYWVIDLVESLVHVHTEPGPNGYRQIERFGRTAVLNACGVAVPVAELFPQT